MDALLPDFRVDGNAVSFWLKVKPRSSRERLTLEPSGELRLELRAPPVESAANEACARFLSKLAGCSRRDVSIVAGHRSRRKLVRIAGPSPDEVIARLQQTAAVQRSALQNEGRPA